MKRRAHTSPHQVWAIQLAMFLAILAIGGLVTAALVKAKKPPEQQERMVKGPLVSVTEVHVADVTMTVTGHGTVRPRVQIDVVPQVGGKVIQVHPSLVAGGFIKAGEPLIQIESTDYKLAVQQARAQLASIQTSVGSAVAAIEQARSSLTLEQAEADVARSQWKQMHGDKPIPLLVARQPQIHRAQAVVSSAEAQRDAAEANVLAAKTTLAEANLNLSRTRISLPFDARVLLENVDLSQTIVPGQPIATVYGVDTVEITVPIEDRELAWFDLPINGQGVGSSAQVIATFAGGRHTWPGRVKRMAGQIDPQSRLVPVVIEVEQPFHTANGRPPLTPGMFVDVVITGRTVSRTIAVPRLAIRQALEVWVVRHGKLDIVPVKIVRTDRQTAYITNGLRDGDQVVVSLLDTVTQGMTVRIPNPHDNTNEHTPSTPTSTAAAAPGVSTTKTGQ
jgi:RND family efflux transporter MFP subunit